MKEYIIAISLIFVFLILGYAPIIKKYLPTKSRYNGRYTVMVKWYLTPTAIITCLIPFIPVRSDALLHINLTETVCIKVKAKGGSRVECINKEELRDLGYQITDSINLRSSKILRHDGSCVVSFTR